MHKNAKIFVRGTKNLHFLEPLRKALGLSSSVRMIVLLNHGTDPKHIWRGGSIES